MASIPPNTQGKGPVPQPYQGVELPYAQPPPPPSYAQPPPYAYPQAPPPSYAQPPPQNYQQPPVAFPVQNGVSVPSRWTTGLFGCFEDCASCFITALCPCITFGQNANMIDSGNTSCACAACIYILILYCFGCPCWYTCCYRPKLRQQYSLPEAPCPDCLLHCFCCWCAICQEFRELKNGGADPTSGWEAYQQKVRSGGVATMAPVVQANVMR